MSPVYLLMGQNSFALTEERLRWMRTFREKHGSENLAVFSAKDVTFRELRDEVTVAPFIAAKRLIVVEGTPKGNKGDAEALLSMMHPDVLLLFVLEQDPSRKPKLTVLQKEIKEISHCTEFPCLSGGQLQQWIRQFLTEQGSSIAPDAMKMLLEMTGEDQSLLAQELRKIAIFASGRRIEENDVRTMVACASERDVWKLMDFLGAGRADEALRYVHGLLERGYSPQALWAMFLWMVSFLVELVALVEEGETNPGAIASELHAHIAGVRAILPFARRVDRPFLIQILERVLEADKGLKTGIFKAPSEAPQEILALIDQSILAFA